MAQLESYVRCTVTERECEYIAGLEFDLDREETRGLRQELRSEMRAAIDRSWRGGDADVAKELQLAVSTRWPGRAYFLEVAHEDPDNGWVQVFQPYGLPRNV